MSRSNVGLLLGGLWVPVGLSTFAGEDDTTPPPPPPPPGAVAPVAATTGVPAGTGLPSGSRTTDIVSSGPGQVISGFNLNGIIKVQHADVTVQYNRVRGNRKVEGKGNNVGLVDCTHAGALRCKVLHNDLVPDAGYVSTGYSGILGHDFDAEFNNVRNTVDGFGCYNNANPTQDLEIILKSNFVHDLAQLSPDPNHTDNVPGKGAVGWSHNDCVQIQGTGSTKGKIQVHSIGNNYQALCSPMVADGGVSTYKTAYYPSVTGQCIGITPNVSAVHDILSDGDFMDGGAQSVTVVLNTKGVGAGLKFINGHYGRKQPSINLGGVSLRRAMRIDPTVALIGLPAKTALDKAIADGGSNNRYADTGEFITVYRIA